MSDALAVLGPEAKRLTWATERPDLPVVGKYSRQAEITEIDDQDSYNAADEDLTALVALEDKYEGMRVEAVTPLNQLKTILQGWFNPVLADIRAAIAIIKAKRLTYQRAQEAKQKVAQAALDDAAARLRASELAKAAKLAQKNPEAAAVARANAEIIVAPVAAPTFTQTKGTVISKVWKAKLAHADGGSGEELNADIIAVIKWVAENVDYMYLLDINWPNAHKLAKMQEAKLCVSGLVAYQEDISAKRRS